MTYFEGPKDGEPERTERLSTQLQAIKEVMLDGDWRTLAELCYLVQGRGVNCPEASASAQLRHLKKERFGGYFVEKRHVANGLYEYRVLAPEPQDA